MVYFLLVMLYAAAMFAVYLLFLRNSTHFQLARYYLLATALLPFLLPLVPLPAGMQTRVAQLGAVAVSLPEFSVRSAVQRYSGAVDYIAIAGWVYAAVAAFLLVRCMLKIWFVYRMVHRHAAVRNGNVFVVRQTGYGPGSFGKYVFFPGGDINEMILAHERAHVQLHHTRDVIIMVLLQAVAWPHVLLPFIRKELEAVHEFQADKQPGANRRDYLELLVSAAFQACTVPLTHSFIVRPIKRRMMMLQKNRTPLLKPVLQVSVSLLLLLPGMMIVQSCSKQSTHDADRQAQINQAMVSKQDKNGVYNVADEMPEFAGGQAALMTYLGNTLKYPEDARKKGVEGRVVVKFVVNETGRVVNPIVVRSPDASLSEAALAAVKTMPAWKPGRKDGKAVSVYFTLPVAFALGS